MICFPNAKINLGLNITEKRSDGYHNIETVFYPITLKDALEIIPSDKTSFTQIGLAIDSLPEQNLVYKALKLLEERYSIPPLHIVLKKVIPFGAGLGGGSSDAASMLKLINSYCQLNLSTEKLENLASILGADCAFFIQNKPTIASGIGNIFESIDLSLKGYNITLIKPNLFVSTQQAYASIKLQKPDLSLKEVINYPICEWKKTLKNDFEVNIFKIYPQIKDIKEKLYDLGAIYAAMSGSGSSVFGIFDKDIELDSFSDHFVWKGILE